MARNHYEILQVSREATDADIKKAYHKLARSNHPDKAQSDEEKLKFEDEFAAITTAYNALKDPVSRSRYDEQLAKEMEKARNAAGASSSPASSSVSSSPRQPTGGGSAPGGGVNVEQGRKEVAKRAFGQGIRLLQLKEWDRASEFFRAATKNDDSVAQYHDKLAVSLLRTKKSFTEAVEAAKRATELDPYKSEYKLHLAELYEAIGSKALAEDVYIDILKWDPDNFVAQEKTKSRRASEAESPLVKWWKKLVGR